MGKLEIRSDPRVEVVFKQYPDIARRKLQEMRSLILETANEIDEIQELEETLKWGEPSYLTKNGSTLRMDWKAKNPNQFALYFKCTSRLVETFRSIFKNTFTFEGNRAIVFQMEEPIPREELKQCIKATLTYHKVKQLPGLGI